MQESSYNKLDAGDSPYETLWIGIAQLHKAEFDTFFPVQPTAILYRGIA